MKDILKYKDFVATLHFSQEDEIFYGKILGIDDSVTFEGDSVNSLGKAFRDAVEEYIETCKEIGKDPLKSYKGSFNVRIKPEYHKQAAYASMQLGISLNQFVERSLENFLNIVSKDNLK